MGLLNWSGSKHSWNKGTTTVVTTNLGGRTGRHRSGKSTCQFCSKTAAYQASNGIKVCRGHAGMLG